MDQDFTIFEGKTYSSLIKDIYDNSVHRKNQVDSLVDELRVLIKGVGDIPQIVPFIKEYLDIAVANDANLVKLASILQRLASSSTGAETDSNGMSIISDAERKQLLSQADELFQDIRKENNSHDQEIIDISKKFKSPSKDT
jgi:hypothetical protein